MKVSRSIEIRVTMGEAPTVTYLGGGSLGLWLETSGEPVDVQGVLNDLAQNMAHYFTSKEGAVCRVERVNAPMTLGVDDQMNLAHLFALLDRLDGEPTNRDLVMIGEIRGVLSRLRSTLPGSALEDRPRPYRDELVAP